MIRFKALILFFLLPVGCKDSGVAPVTAQLEFVGFEDKFALRMILADPYLYVCAGSDGVWRRDVRRMTEWEYVGLRDTSLGNYTNVGALDIDVLAEDILVAYNGSAPHVNPESTVAVWRSTNCGGSWFRSDSGVPESRKYPEESNVINGLQRSPHRREVVIAVYGPAYYRSIDNGYQWEFSGVRGVLVNTDHVRWHPFRPGELWFFGETALFAPYCGAAQDYGTRGKVGVNWDSLGFPPDGAVTDIAFDVGDPNIVYAATSYGVIKTIDGGYTWRSSVIKLPDNGFVFQMANHPSLDRVLYLAGGRRVYVTRDGGASVQSVCEIERGFIASLVFDPLANQLFIGTTEGGIYALKLLVGE